MSSAVAASVPTRGAKGATADEGKSEGVAPLRRELVPGPASAPLAGLLRLCCGRLVAAVEEERFRRVKHWAGFPAESVQFCLDAAGITTDQVDHLAINSEINSRKHLARWYDAIRERASYQGAVLDWLPDAVVGAFQKAGNQVAEDLAKAVAD